MAATKPGESGSEPQASADKFHEAGYDAYMTGVLWFKLQTKIHGECFPGTDQIQQDEQSLVCDKNKLPLASIRSSLDLAKLTPSIGGDLSRSQEKEADPTRSS